MQILLRSNIKLSNSFTWTVLSVLLHYLVPTVVFVCAGYDIDCSFEVYLLLTWRRLSGWLLPDISRWPSRGSRYSLCCRGSVSEKDVWNFLSTTAFRMCLATVHTCLWSSVLICYTDKILAVQPTQCLPVDCPVLSVWQFICEYYDTLT
jgi:hypothetical protein